MHIVNIMKACFSEGHSAMYSIQTVLRVWPWIIHPHAEGTMKVWSSVAKTPAEKVESGGGGPSVGNELVLMATMVKQQ